MAAAAAVDFRLLPQLETGVLVCDNMADHGEWVHNIRFLRTYAVQVIKSIIPFQSTQHENYSAKNGRPFSIIFAVDVPAERLEEFRDPEPMGAELAHDGVPVNTYRAAAVWHPLERGPLSRSSRRFSRVGREPSRPSPTTTLANPYFRHFSA